MKKTNDAVPPVGNRTGVSIAPDLAMELIKGVEMSSPETNLDQSGAAKLRAKYVAEGVPVGSIPPAEDAETAVLIDKLGARLAFERAGVRLYDALIQKRQATTGKTTPSVADLQHIREEELAHMHLLESYISDVGGDPTALTPAADIEATMTSGVLKVAIDPRTTMSQCLQAILAAELIDNDCWEVLIGLIKQQGLDDDVSDFEAALEEEQEHLQKVRSWILADHQIAAA